MCLCALARRCCRPACLPTMSEPLAAGTMLMLAASVLQSSPVLPRGTLSEVTWGVGSVLQLGLGPSLPSSWLPASCQAALGSLRGGCSEACPTEGSINLSPRSAVDPASSRGPLGSEVKSC